MAWELPLSQHSRVIKGHNMDPGGQREGEGEVLGVRPARVRFLLALWCWVTYFAFQRWSLTWDVMRLHKIRYIKSPAQSKQSTDVSSLSVCKMRSLSSSPSANSLFKTKLSAQYGETQNETELIESRRAQLLKQDCSNTLHKAGKMVFH